MSDGDQQLLPNPEGRFGRHVWHDPRNREFPARGVLFAADAPLLTKSWWRRGVYDQGHTSSCTAQAAAGLVETSPFRQAHRPTLPLYDSHEERYALYREAQKHDPWEGEYEGSSTDAPFKVLRLRGHITAWRWAFGIDDVVRTLSHHGPVAVGTWWREGMMTPEGSGAWIEPSGANLGGHAYQLLGVTVRDGKAVHVTGLNSWGGSWGRNGRFRMKVEHLAELLAAQGEAVTIVREG